MPVGKFRSSFVFDAVILVLTFVFEGYVPPVFVSGFDGGVNALCKLLRLLQL